MSEFQVSQSVTREWLSRVFKLRGLKRYNDRIQILSEDVAQHSYFVSLIVLQLAQDYKFDTGRALSMAIIHDLPELYCSDVSHRVKSEFPQVGRAIKEAEAQIWHRHFPYEWGSLARELEDGKTIEALIVLLADAVSVLQYSDCEISLGNSTPEMQRVRVETELRVADLKLQLNKLTEPLHIYLEGFIHSGKGPLADKLKSYPRVQPRID